MIFSEVSPSLGGLAVPVLELKSGLKRWLERLEDQIQ